MQPVLSKGSLYTNAYKLSLIPQRRCSLSDPSTQIHSLLGKLKRGFLSQLV